MLYKDVYHIMGDVGQIIFCKSNGFQAIIISYYFGKK